MVCFLGTGWDWVIDAGESRNHPWISWKWKTRARTWFYLIIYCKKLLRYEGWRVGIWDVYEVRSMEDRGVWGYNFVKNVDHSPRKIYPPYHGGMGGIFSEQQCIISIKYYAKIIY